MLGRVLTARSAGNAQLGRSVLERLLLERSIRAENLQLLGESRVVEPRFTLEFELGRQRLKA